MRIASPNPVRCAACYASSPGVPHVDFEAATDGPVFIDPETGAVLAWEGGSVTIEQVVLCEPCIKAAAALLEVPPQVVTELQAQILDAKKEAREWRRRAEAARSALGEWQDTKPKDQPKRKVTADV